MKEELGDAIPKTKTMRSSADICPLTEALVEDLRRRVSDLEKTWRHQLSSTGRTASKHLAINSSTIVPYWPFAVEFKQ